MKKKYDKFIFFSAGPVGDHLAQIDFANRFYESTGISSVLVMKHPNKFVKNFSIPYPHSVSYLDFIGYKGFLRLSKLALVSIVRSHCYILIFPIPPPRYLILFSYYIRFCTRSRIVGFNVEGTKSFPIGGGYERFLGKKNSIPLLPEMFYESANRMLTFLGYKPVDTVPVLDYVYHRDVFERFGITKGEYIVMHLNASHCLRTFPTDRWNIVIAEVIKRLPGVKILMTGSRGDVSFINECISGLPKDTFVIDTGSTNTQEALTLYANPKMAVTVNTGIGLVLNMLHTPTVVVAVKGTTMFDYRFNKNATILYSKKDCICNPLEMNCNMVTYKGNEYMACIFNLSNEEVVDAIVAKYKENI